MNNCPECGSEFLDIKSSREMEVSQIDCTDCGFGIQEKIPEEDLIQIWNNLESKI